MNKHAHNEKGFTLIETLVALVIFTSAITAMLVLTGQGVLGTNYAKNRLTAGFLAQEGIELVRFIRDSSLLEAPATGWTDVVSAFASCGEATPGCLLDTSVLSAGTSNARYDLITPCSGTCPLYYDSIAGYNTRSLGAQSLYTRTITVEPVNTGATTFLRITSNVVWTQGTNVKSVALTENLFDWAVIP